MIPTRACWCGRNELRPFSAEYRVCTACGTLVSTAPLAPVATPTAATTGGPKAGNDLYSEKYWLERQREHHGLPDIHARSRLDLPERCAHWLQHFLAVRLPPGRVLEVGCGHGGFVALLDWAGFSVIGTEMSPWVVDLAKKTFGIDVRVGPIEAQPFAAGSFDGVILNDVIEHLADPLGTLTTAARLLKADGFFVVQTPEFKEHLSYADLLATNDLFLKHMTNNNDEHLYLFSRRSAQEIFCRAGFPVVSFLNPIYSYDLYFTASESPLEPNNAEQIWGALSARPQGRLVQALLDKAYESKDRWWAIKRLEEERERKGLTQQG